MDASSPAVSGGGIHLTPELISRMATFADANFSPDVMKICLAVGPVVSRTIKHDYLRRNEKYLTDALKKLVVRLCSFTDSGSEKAGANHRAWMEVNADWKTTAVRNDLMGTTQQNRLVQSVLAGHVPFLAFNNTAFAVELGLLEVVKFLIEDKGVDPNEYGWTVLTHSSYRYHLVSAAMNVGREDIFQYLLSLPSTNLYSEVDNNDDRDWNHGLFEQALDKYVEYTKEKAFLTSFVNHNRFDVNRACHRYCTFPNRDFTCLDIVLYRLENCLSGFEEDYGVDEDPDLSVGDSERLDRYIDVIRLLLEAGAKSNQNILEGLGSGIDLVQMWLRALHPNDGYPSIRLLKERVYRQVLAMMREVQAPRGQSSLTS